MTVNVQEINRIARDLRAGLGPLFSEISKVIVGQKLMVDRLLIGLLTGGHVLLEGVPGLAKTLAVRTLASCTSGIRTCRLNRDRELRERVVAGQQRRTAKSAKRGSISSDRLISV